MVASDISDQSQAFCLAGVLVRLNPIPNKDRATNPPQEKPGGEGWLAGRSSKQNIQLGAREKFAGFDQPLQDRVSAFYASSNEAFAQ